MSELDDILDKSFLHDQSLAKQQLKALMLGIFGKSLEGGSVAEMGNIFRKEVREL